MLFWGKVSSSAVSKINNIKTMIYLRYMCILITCDAIEHNQVTGKGPGTVHLLARTPRSSCVMTSSTTMRNENTCFSFPVQFRNLWVYKLHGFRKDRGTFFNKTKCTDLHFFEKNLKSALSRYMWTRSLEWVVSTQTTRCSGFAKSLFFQFNGKPIWRPRRTGRSDALIGEDS